MPTPEPASAPGACPIERVLAALGGKWKILLIWHLQDDTLRYGALKRRIPAVSERMLIRSLRELEADGLVQRTAYPEVPPRVEYALTERARHLLPVLNQLAEWGLAHLSAEPC